MNWRLILCLMVLPLAVQAGQNQRLDRELHGIKGTDNRVEVDAGRYPWRAMGRLNNGLGGHCSAVLVGPRLLATAAHCLWNQRTRAVIPAGSLTFVAGYDRGQYLAASKVTALHPAPGWSFPGASGLAARAHDWALLELAEPLGQQLGWVAPGDPPRPGESLTAAGYGKDKAHIPTAHQGCSLTGRQTGLLISDCDAVQGDSGGPVMVWRDGMPVLVGLNAAVILDKRELSVAVSAEALRAAARSYGGAAASSRGSQ